MSTQMRPRAAAGKSPFRTVRASVRRPPCPSSAAAAGSPAARNRKAKRAITRLRNECQRTRTSAEVTRSWVYDLWLHPCPQRPVARRSPADRFIVLQGQLPAHSQSSLEAEASTHPKYRPQAIAYNRIQCYPENVLAGLVDDPLVPTAPRIRKTLEWNRYVRVARQNWTDGRSDQHGG